MTEEKPHYTPGTPRGRRASTFSHGYSAAVRILRIALPILALVIVGIVFARLSSDPQQQHITDMPADTKTTAGQVELMDARYEGVDVKGKAYTVTADSASRVKENPDAAELVNPKAEVTLESGESLSIAAKDGVYDNKTSLLRLTTDVKVSHDSGYTLSMTDALVNVSERTAETPNPVSAEGPMGTLTAQNMRITEGGDMVIFGGPATLTLFRLTQKKDAP